MIPKSQERQEFPVRASDKIDHRTEATGEFPAYLKRTENITKYGVPCTSGTLCGGDGLDSSA